MPHPFPIEVKKCERPLDEEELRAHHHEGLALITCIQTATQNDPHGPRYWYYFKVSGYAEK